MPLDIQCLGFIPIIIVYIFHILSSYTHLHTQHMTINYQRHKNGYTVTVLILFCHFTTKPIVFSYKRGALQQRLHITGSRSPRQLFLFALCLESTSTRTAHWLIDSYV